MGKKFWRIRGYKKFDTIIDPKREHEVRRALSGGTGILKVAQTPSIGTGTVARIVSAMRK